MARRAMAMALLVGLVGATTIDGAGLAGRRSAPPDWGRLIVTDGAAAAAERQAVARALRLLPALPARVAVLDAEQALPDVKPVLLRLDAFVVKGRPEVYVVRQSVLLRCAMQEAPLCGHALAAVIWHEMAHVAGADEREARRREEALWTTFIRDQAVDPVSALRYLEAMVYRPDDHLMAGR